MPKGTSLGENKTKENGAGQMGWGEGREG